MRNSGKMNSGGKVRKDEKCWDGTMVCRRAQPPAQLAVSRSGGPTRAHSDARAVGLN